MQKSIIIILFFSFVNCNNKSKEDMFWNWFKKHQNTFYSDDENPIKREQSFNLLSKQLNLIHPDLVFEFSPIRDNGIKELSISSNGDKELFKTIANIIAKAPKINNWKFNSLRQRIPGDDFEINFKELTIGYSDIFFRHNNEKYGNIGIEIYIEDNEQEDDTRHAVYILLDGLIGEYDVTIGIDWIDWKKLDKSSISELNLKPILNLRQLIDLKKIDLEK